MTGITPFIDVICFIKDETGLCKQKPQHRSWRHGTECVYMEECFRACVCPWSRWLCVTAKPKQIFWGGSGSLLVSSGSLGQREGSKGGLLPQSEIWWHNWATREPGVCPQFMFSGTHLLKRAPGLGLHPGTGFKARGSKVMKWVQERTGIMSWWNREGEISGRRWENIHTYELDYNSYNCKRYQQCEKECGRLEHPIIVQLYVIGDFDDHWRHLPGRKKVFTCVSFV